MTNEVHERFFVKSDFGGIRLDTNGNLTAINVNVAPDTHKFGVSQLEQASKSCELPSNGARHFAGGLVTKVVLDFCPGVLKDRADLDFGLHSSKRTVFRQSRSLV